MPDTPENTVPLCVDLDGTLVQTDMLFETLLVLIKQKPWCVAFLPFWLYKGKANLKHQIIRRIAFVPGTLPFTKDVVAYVREEKKHRKTVLVTGSHQSIADSIAEETNLFDEVKGSTQDVNLTCVRKKAWLLDRFGENGFDYIGNDKDDLSVWPAAREALAVSFNTDGIAQASNQTFSKVFTVQRPAMADFVSMLRVHQWSKNLLIFVPFILDQRFGDWVSLGNAALAFIAMSLLASCTYILNDMLDLQADRINETKSKRPLPSGRISITDGFKAMACLALVLLLVMSFMTPVANLMLGIYLIATLKYSFLLKSKPILDITMLAALHTHRIIIGSVVIVADLSFWLLAFSMFLFFSLAIAKRVSELMNLKKTHRTTAMGRAYRVSDLPFLLASGVSSGYLSVLIVALYINSDKVQVNYALPEILWLLCPVLVYWVGRLWLVASRGDLHEDPIVFAMHDKVSLVTIAALGAVVILAIAL